MQHEIAAGHRLRPAGIGLQVGGGERQRVAGFSSANFQHRAYVAFALQVSYRGADLMARGEELQNGMAADKA